MSTLRNTLETLFTFVVLGAVIFFFHDQIMVGFRMIEQRYLPCKRPITYHLGVLDKRFGLSDAQFKKALLEAEAIWEEPMNKDLFTLSDNGGMAVNLVYDDRQATTEKLKSVDSELKDDKASLNKLQFKYDMLYAQYGQDKYQFEQKKAAYQSDMSEYEGEVAYWNKRGGASKEAYAELQAKRTALETERRELEALQSKVNSEVDEVNKIVEAIRTLAREFNQDATKYNTIGASQGSEFDEGVYESDRDGERITIYQYDTYQKLVRVLAHELGHALGLEHLDDPKAIMYYLNQSAAGTATKADISALNAHCGIAE